MSSVPLIAAEKGWTKLAGTEKTGRRGSPGISASLTTAMSGSNNDLVVSALKAGLAGNDLQVQWSNLGGFSMPGRLYNGGTPAYIVISPSSGTDILLVAKDPGTGGNAITYTAVNSAVPSDALAVSVSGKDISVNLALGAGTAQVETATVGVGTISTAGNVSVTVTSAGMTGSPLVVSVAVALNDTTNTIATKIRAALTANAVVNAKFAVSGATSAVILTTRVAAANDATLNIGIIDGTSVGATTVATSANTTAGVAPAVTSTAATIIAAINASTAASELVTAFITETSSGISAAVSATNLAAGTTDSNLTYVALGTDGSGAISTTGAQLSSLLNGSLVNAKASSTDTGAGTVAALSATNLAGGLDGYGIAGNIQDVKDSQDVLNRPGAPGNNTNLTLQVQTDRLGAGRTIRQLTAQDAVISSNEINITKQRGPRSPFL